MTQEMAEERRPTIMASKFIKLLIVSLGVLTVSNLAAADLRLSASDTSIYIGIGNRGSYFGFTYFDNDAWWWDDYWYFGGYYPHHWWSDHDSGVPAPQGSWDDSRRSKRGKDVRQVPNTAPSNPPPAQIQGNSGSGNTNEGNADKNPEKKPERKKRRKKR